jgi:hypothetical protein
MWSPQVSQPRPTHRRRSRPKPPTSIGRSLSHPKSRTIELRDAASPSTTASPPHRHPHSLPTRRIPHPSPPSPAQHTTARSDAEHTQQALYRTASDPAQRSAAQQPSTMSGTPGASMPPAAGPGTADHYIIGKNTRPANPTPLSAPQEQQVRDLYYKNVRAKCAPEIEGSSLLPLTNRKRNINLI